jgi:pimeloyl-ACP methyl ester carboxylesterase
LTDTDLPPGIAVARWGDEGQLAVLVHGGAQGSASAGHANFSHQKPLAEQSWRLLVPDRPGHGQSPNPGRPDDAEADAAWVAQLLGDGAHLMGHSFGGLVALGAAAKRPQAVRSLTLIEPALFAVATGSPVVRKQLMRMAASMILPFSKAEKARRLMKLLGIPDGVFTLSEADLTAMGGALTQIKFPPKATIGRWIDTVAAARIPLLIVSGGSNAAFVATGEIVAARGGGKHAVIPAEHHFPQWSGEPFNRLVADFWREAERDDIGSGQ